MSSWSNIVKKLNDDDLENLTKYKNNKIEVIEEDNELKPEDCFKNFEEEFDNKYNLKIFDIYYDLKEIIKENDYNYKINFDSIYDIIMKYSKESKKLISHIKNYNNEIVEEFKNEELNIEDSDF